MTDTQSDIWYQWLLHRRFGGDPARLKATMDYLIPVRDRVLSRVRLAEGGTLLDVGCGDGLIAFGALEKFPTCTVIFSDISQDLLDHAQGLAQQMGLSERCRFLQADATDLSALPDASVDAVTTRSVLIYVSEKQTAFNEFYRVLASGGWLSIFEPINNFGSDAPPNLFWGYDVTPVQDIAARVRAVYEHIQPRDSDPMLNFTERDLAEWCEHAGFDEITLEFTAHIARHTHFEAEVGANLWQQLLTTAFNPRIPTLEEAMAQVLTPQEIETFVAHLRPLVETGQRARLAREALAYLWATKRG